jgi:hypothetical protein
MVALYLSTRTGHFICRWLWRRYVVVPTNEIEKKELQELYTPGTQTPTFEGSADSLNSEEDHEHAKELQKKEREIIQRALKRQKLNERVKDWVRQFTSVAIMMVSCSQILYSFALEPDTLAKPYLSFLMTHSGIRDKFPKRSKEYLSLLEDSVKASGIVQTTRKLNDSPSMSECFDPALPIEKAMGFDLIRKRVVSHEYMICSVQHPDRSVCLYSFTDALIAEFRRAWALYGPLNAV